MAKVGETVQLFGRLHKGSGIATVVDIIPAGVVPDSKKVSRYYFCKPEDPGMKSAYKALKFDRIVLQRKEGGYIVMPDTPNNQRYWR